MNQEMLDNAKIAVALLSQAEDDVAVCLKGDLDEQCMLVAVWLRHLVIEANPEDQNEIAAAIIKKVLVNYKLNEVSRA